MKNQKYSFWENIKRLLKQKLFLPLLRSKHPPEYKALGVSIGVAWAMTPLVGIQMWLCLMTWLVMKKIFNKHFSLALACAWTWITNVFTMFPIYYIFYATGQILRGHFSNISGYSTLTAIINETFTQDYTFTEKWGLFFKLLLKDWGISMALGCLPWAIIGGIASYYLTIRFERKRQERLLAKMGAKKNASE